MKGIKYLLIKAAFVGLTVIIFACKSDDNTCYDPSNSECENYDPCYDKLPTAEFTISKQYFPFGANANFFVEDSVLTPGGNVKFTAIPQEGASYTWVIGTDTLLGDYEITKELTNFSVGTHDISLMVTKPTDTICFPHDEGSAQFNKSFIKIRSCEADILGKYRGVFSTNPSDSVVIILALSPSFNSIEPCDSTAVVGEFFSVNFNANEDTIPLNINGFVNTQISFESQNESGIPEGEVIYDPKKNTVEAIFSIDLISYHFIGRKL